MMNADSSPSSLEGKVAVVTGGSRGIGRAICLGLSAQGAKVVVASRTETDASAGTTYEKYGSGTIGETLSRIEEQGGSGIAVKGDVSQAEDIKGLVATALDRLGRIDILVSNAGIDCESPVVDLEIEDLDRCLAVNVRGPFLLCKFALPAMIASGSGGSIICITSGAARAYRLGRIGYSMSKAALDRMFLSLAEEVRSHNIAVNVLSPGRVDTWMNRRGDWPGTAHIPMTQPEAIIPAAVWLASQTADTFTGQLIERAEFGKSWGHQSPA